MGSKVVVRRGLDATGRFLPFVADIIGGQTATSLGAFFSAEWQVPIVVCQVMLGVAPAEYNMLGEWLEDEDDGDWEEAARRKRDDIFRSIFGG
jgi:hypothetical protein